MRRTARVILILLSAALLGGCRVSNPWVYDPPPAIHASDMAAPAPRGRTVIAIEEFSDPEMPAVKWPGIGAAMTDALRRALMLETGFTVVIKTGSLQTQGPEMERALADGIDYLITGRVTDFAHTSDMPRKVRRWGIIGRRREAVVAFEFKIRDTHRDRVVVADHLYGAAKSGLLKQYKGISLNTYLFWSTPLGQASYQAIERMVDRVMQLVPEHSGALTIVRADPDRRIHVKGGRQLGVVEGTNYFVYRQPVEGGGIDEAIRDGVTNDPLWVKVTSVSRDGAVGLLYGEPVSWKELSGAILLRVAPQPQEPDSSPSEIPSGSENTPVTTGDSTGSPARMLAGN